MDNNKKNYCFDAIPETKLRLYTFLGLFNSAYFDKEEELQNYLKTGDMIGNTCIIDYLGSIAGEKDVIRLKYKNKKPIICTILNEGGYAIYNTVKSSLAKEYIWEYRPGILLNIYSEFNKRGIVFEDDVYFRIMSKKNRQTINMDSYKEKEENGLVKKIGQKKK